MSRTQAFTFFLVCLVTPTAAFSDISGEINNTLEYFAEVWGEGELAAIRGYYHPDFVLIANGNKISLSQRMADLELLMKPGEDHAVLTYSEITVQPLGEEHALAYGHVKLSFNDETSLEFWFNTVNVKTPFGWKALMTHN